jgi:hypothetical protein
VFRTNCRTYRKNLNENGIELEELLADGGYSSGEALAYLHEKNINAYIPNFGQYKSEREGFTSTKKKTIINAQNPKVSKRNCFSKAKKWIVKATPNERTEAAKQIAKTVH